MLPRFGYILRWTCLFALAISGCGPKGPQLVKVEGTVLIGAKPLHTGYVIFHPDLSKGNKSQEQPRGVISSDGRYKLITYAKEGAPPGWYRVAVTAAHENDPKDPYFTKWLIPERYIDYKSSKLALEVVEKTAPGAYDIKLDAK